MVPFFVLYFFWIYSTVVDTSSFDSSIYQLPTKGCALRLGVQMRFAYLWTSTYSPYQQQLFDLITSKYDHEGCNFKQVSDWLNANGYKTPRGKTFKENHVWSIYKKKNRSIQRFSREFEPAITDIGIDIVDIKPVSAAI